MYLNFKQLLFLFFIKICFFSSVSAQTSPLRFTRNSDIDTLKYRIQTVAVGDVTGNGFDDLVIVGLNENPKVAFFSPDSGRYFLHPNHELPIAKRANYGPVLILDVDDQPGNEIVINYFNRDTVSVFQWRDTSFFALPGAVAQAFNVREIDNLSHVAFADFDNDGRLDYIHSRQAGSRSPENYIVWNALARGGQNLELDLQGTLSFQISQTTATHLGYLNKDRFPDVFWTNPLSDKHKLFRGNNGLFEDLAASPVSVVSNSNSALLFDADGDGNLDLLRLHGGTNLVSSRNIYYKNDGEMNFTQVEIGAPVLESRDSQNAMSGDFDNDGDLDLVIAENNAPVSVYENNGSGNFIKRNLDVAGVSSNWRFALLYDYDQDGQLELITLGTQPTGSIRVYENNGNENNWIGFNLISSNTFFSEPFGARLEVTIGSESQAKTLIREIFPTNGFFMQAPMRQHVGLGTASSAQLKIYWPSGLVQEISYSTSDLNSYHEITEPLAGKVVALNAPFLQVPSDEVTTDSLVIQNVGQAIINFESIRSEGLFEVIDAPLQLNVGETSFIRLRYLARVEHGFDVTENPLRIESDAINGDLTLPIRTRNTGQSAPFQNVTYQTSSQSAFPQPPFWLFSPDSKSDILPGYSPDGFRGLFSFRLTDSTLIPLSEIPSQQAFNLEPLDRPSPSSWAFAQINFMEFPDLVSSHFDEKSLLLNPLLEENAFDLSQNEAPNTSVALFDIDGNGWIDIILGRTNNQANTIFMNRDGFFERKTFGSFTSTPSSSTHILPVDLNNDGTVELISTEDNIQGASFIRVFQQELGERFEPVEIEGLTDFNFRSNGTLPIDFDNDGDFDLLFLSAFIGIPSKFFRNDGAFIFTEVEFKVFKNLPGNAVDATVIDYNLDGYLDLFLVYSAFSGTNRLLINEAGQNFSNVPNGELVELRETVSRYVSQVDINQDAIPDLILSHQDRMPNVFINVNAKVSDNNWFALRPFVLSPNNGSAEGADGNLRSILVPGTRVDLTFSQGSQMLTQSQLVGFQSVKVRAANPIFSGLGSAQQVTARVFTPDGQRSQASFEDVNQYHSMELESVILPTEEIPYQTPSQTQLHPAFPNPFNPTTTITFELSRAGEVELHILNVLGQQVATLVNARLNAGSHTRVFNAQGLASGLYFSVLRTENRVLVQKLTLIK